MGIGTVQIVPVYLAPGGLISYNLENRSPGSQTDCFKPPPLELCGAARVALHSGLMRGLVDKNAANSRKKSVWSALYIVLAHESYTGVQRNRALPRTIPDKK